MGIFIERRTSLPAMNLKLVNESEQSTPEISKLDKDFVHKMSTENGVDILTQYEDHENNGPNYHCLVRLEPVKRDKTLYSIRLATNIPSMKLKTSCTFR